MLERLVKMGATALAAMIIAGCAHTPPSNPQDPFESINRKIYTFNDTLDLYVLRPVAKGYRKVTPDPVALSVGRFFDNSSYPVTIGNSFLQAKPHNTMTALTRFIVNSTIGFGGLFDVATGLGLPRHIEDFGQTLGYWGVGQGVYLMLPLLGPTTARDGIGRIANRLLEPSAYIGNLAASIGVEALYLVDFRASLLGFDRTVRNAFDPYLFVRTGYLQDRLGAVYDGNPPKKYTEDEDTDYDLP